MIHQVSSRFRLEFDKQVDIAVGAHLTCSGRSENEKFPDTILPAQCPDSRFIDLRIAEKDRPRHLGSIVP